MSRLQAYVVTAPGLEQVTAAEMAKLDLRVVDLGVGGLTCSITWPQLAVAHLHLRTATRVLVRLDRFPASGFGDLQAGLANIPLHHWLPRHSAVQLHVSSSASRLNHTGAIEERVRAVVRREQVEGLEYEGGVYALHVRISRNIATVSLDATGTPLYQRGWRVEAGAAPLRETLAAALLQWSGATVKNAAIVDPCCGAGTIAIEAAQMARRLPAGGGRSFAFERWLPVDTEQTERVRRAAQADVRPPRKHPIRATDIDPATVEVARANAERAGVTDDVRFDTADARAVPADASVVTNPPYGHRLAVADRRGLFQALGRSARLAVVAPAASLASFGREFDETLSTSNGGLAVRFARVGFTT